MRFIIFNFFGKRVGKKLGNYLNFFVLSQVCTCVYGDLFKLVYKITSGSSLQGYNNPIFPSICHSCAGLLDILHHPFLLLAVCQLNDFGAPNC